MLLPEHIDVEGPFPRLSRRLRLGVIGGGRISGMQATAARLTDRWEVVAGAFSSDPAIRFSQVLFRSLTGRLPTYLPFISLSAFMKSSTSKKETKP